MLQRKSGCPFIVKLHKSGVLKKPVQSVAKILCTTETCSNLFQTFLGALIAESSTFLLQSAFYFISTHLEWCSNFQKSHEFSTARKKTNTSVLDFNQLGIFQDLGNLLIQEVVRLFLEVGYNCQGFLGIQEIPKKPRTLLYNKN